MSSGFERGHSVRLAVVAELPGLARLIAQWNRDPESCCLHLESEPTAVLAELTAGGAEPLILVVEEGGPEIEALLGADLDPSSGRAWLWGPYFRTPSEAATLGAALFAALREQRPAMVRADSFLDERNQAAQQCLLGLGFRERGRVLVYTALRPEPLEEPPAPCLIARPEHVPSLAALHDSAFPDTYRDAAELVARADLPTEKTFVVAEGDRVLGYIHAGLDDSATAGFIRFLAVAPDARRQGHGRRLLASATHWLFAGLGVSQVDLTVFEGGTDARALYTLAGFTHARTGVTSFWTGA